MLSRDPLWVYDSEWTYTYWKPQLGMENMLWRFTQVDFQPSRILGRLGARLARAKKYQNCKENKETAVNSP
jgi:hypothetical protein